MASAAHFTFVIFVTIANGLHRAHGCLKGSASFTLDTSIKCGISSGASLPSLLTQPPAPCCGTPNGYEVRSCLQPSSVSLPSSVPNNCGTPIGLPSFSAVQFNTPYPSSPLASVNGAISSYGLLPTPISQPTASFCGTANSYGHPLGFQSSPGSLPPSIVPPVCYGTPVGFPPLPAIQLKAPCPSAPPSQPSVTIPNIILALLPPKPTTTPSEAPLVPAYRPAFISPYPLGSGIIPANTCGNQFYDVGCNPQPSVNVPNIINALAPSGACR